MLCRLCGSNNCQTLTSLNCGNLKPSTLYATVKVAACNDCGHIFNPLKREDMEGIFEYYKEEYSVGNLASPSLGDFPGSENAHSLERYNHLYSAIKDYAKANAIVLDIGCASGGYLSFLKELGYANLIGVDLCPAYVVEAKKKDGILITQGTAEKIPFAESEIDVVVCNQVVEHLFDPNVFFYEARRVLRNGGYLCVSVPDSTRYDDFFFFEYYWFLLREHIHHFDENHLRKLANTHGFVCEKVIKTETKMLGEKAMLPNLTIVFRVDKLNAPRQNVLLDFDLKRRMQNYIANQRSIHAYRIDSINRLYKTNTPFYVYGMSREFMYLYENTNLKHCNILGFFDDIPVKQTKKVDDALIQPGSELEKCATSCLVLITAFAHTEVLTRKVNEKGHSWITI